VTGGGIIGSVTAYYLTRHSLFDPEQHEVVVLEANRIASAASGKSGGLLASWAYPSTIAPLSFRLHRELAREHGGHQLWGYRPVCCGHISLTPRHQQAATIDGPNSNTTWTSWTSLPTLLLGKLKNRVLLRRSTIKAAELPPELDWFDPECAEGYEDLDQPGSEGTAQVLPYPFTKSMVKLAEQRGAKVIIASAQKINYRSAIGPEGSNGSPHDDTADLEQIADLQEGTINNSFTNTGSTLPSVESVTYLDKATGETRTIPATTVVLAAGPWTPSLFPEAPISAMRAHSITVKTIKELSPYCLFTDVHVPEDSSSGSEKDDYSSKPGSVSDANNFSSNISNDLNSATASRSHSRIISPEMYARPNNELYVCGEGDTDVPLPASSEEVEVSMQACQALADTVASVFADEVLPTVVTSRRACYLPTVSIGASGGPIVGPTGRVTGLIVASGHGCWGIQNAPATGLLVSEMILDGCAKSADVSSLDPTRVM
jgi:glycine/D-amino acid oxidase-like deaminating enzyme